MRGEKQVVLQSLARLWDGPVCKHTKWARWDLAEQPLLLAQRCDAIYEIRAGSDSPQSCQPSDDNIWWVLKPVWSKHQTCFSRNSPAAPWVWEEEEGGGQELL